MEELMLLHLQLELALSAVSSSSPNMRNQCHDDARESIGTIVNLWR
jgi:hypothetical protein